MRTFLQAGLMGGLFVALAACGERPIGGEDCTVMTPEAFEAFTEGREASSEVGVNGLVSTAYTDGGVAVSTIGSNRVVYNQSVETAVRMTFEGASIYFRLQPGETRFRVGREGIECGFFPAE